MMCRNCEQYDLQLEIHGPAQLRRIVRKIKGAVHAGILRVDNDLAGRDDPMQPPFLELELGAMQPDGISYHFECPACGRRYALSCDLYHGRGGRWQPL